MVDDMPNKSNDLSPPIEGNQWKAQQDYAWEWFKYHAKQRTDMFNYFLIATGLLITGYVNLRKDNHLILSAAVSLVGLSASIGFFFLTAAINN